MVRGLGFLRHSPHSRLLRALPVVVLCERQVALDGPTLDPAVVWRAGRDELGVTLMAGTLPGYGARSTRPPVRELAGHAWSRSSVGHRTVPGR